MCAIAVKSKPDTLMLIDGRGEMRFALEDLNTEISHIYQQDPVKLMFPKVASGEVPQGIVVITSGGLVGGDRIALDFSVGERASAMIMAQAAEKIYRSPGADCLINVKLTAEMESWAEYLPQETILFDGARLNRTTRIEAAAGARVLAGEILVFGRHGSGETFSNGFLRDAWEVRRNKKLAWAETILLETNIPHVLYHPACFAGAAAAATAIFVCDDADMYLDLSRKILENHKGTNFTAVSVVNGVMVVRFIGKDTLELRNAFGNFWQTFRNQVAGLPNSLPRLWHI